jgi:hypothetical protein
MAISPDCQDKRESLYVTLSQVLRVLTNSVPIRSNVPHIHLSIIWNGPRMAPIRIYRSDCILLAFESMDIQAKAIPLLPLRVRQSLQMREELMG